MAVGKVFKLMAVTTSAGQINEITDVKNDPGVETMLMRTDGQVDRTFAAVQSIAPKFTFASHAIALALAAAGLNGLSVLDTGDPVSLYFQQAAPGGTRLTGNTATRCSASKGILAAKSIDAPEKGPAKIDYELQAVSPDGTTSPLTVAVNQALPAAVTTRQFYMVGPVSLNGVTLTSVKSWKLDLGIDIAVEMGDGEAYPTFTYIKARNPTFTVRTLDLTVASTIGIAVPQNATDSKFYLRKVAPGGTRVPNATAEHIAFIVDDGMITVTEMGASGDEPGEIEIKLDVSFDGVNDAVALNLATAIT